MVLNALLLDAQTVLASQPHLTAVMHTQPTVIYGFVCTLMQAMPPLGELFHTNWPACVVVASIIVLNRIRYDD